MPRTSLQTRAALPVIRELGGSGTLSAGAPQFPCFDGFRAIAAVMVLVVHASIGVEIMTGHPAGPYLERMDAGVVVFFVVSGFLLYRPFALDHLRGARPMPIRSFWRRRALRIFPAYWVAFLVIVYALGQSSIDSPGSLWLYLGLLQTYDPGRVLGGLSQAWTLCIELSFYALLPLYAWVLGSRHRTVSRQLRLEWIGLASLVGISVAYRLVVRAADIGSYTLNWLPGWLDMFAIGMALAVLSATIEHTGVRPRVTEAIGRHPALCWAGAIAAFWAVATQLALPARYVPLTVIQEFGRHYLYGLFGLLVVLPGVFGPQHKGRLRGLLQNRAVVAIGIVSYGIYLWHIAMLQRVLEQLEAIGWITLPLTVAGGLAASYLVALLSYRIIEKPALRLKGPGRVATTLAPPP